MLCILIRIVSSPFASICDLVLWLTLSDSNYPCPEKISLVQKIFEPLKFEYVWYKANASNLYPPYMSTFIFS